MGVRDDQQSAFGIPPQGDSALFIMVVVLDGQRSFVMEYRFSLCEADALVLEFVGCVLCLVELNFEWLHYAYFICI